MMFELGHDLIVFPCEFASFYKLFWLAYGKFQLVDETFSLGFQISALLWLIFEVEIGYFLGGFVALNKCTYSL